jgi:hypothetical protein
LRCRGWRHELVGPRDRRVHGELLEALPPTRFGWQSEFDRRYPCLFIRWVLDEVRHPVVGRIQLRRLVGRHGGEGGELRWRAMELAWLQVPGRRETGGLARLRHLVGVGFRLHGGVRVGGDPGRRFRDGGRVVVLTGIDLDRLVRRDRRERGEVGRGAMEFAGLEAARRRQTDRLTGRLVRRFGGGRDLGRVGDLGSVPVEEEGLLGGEEAIGWRRCLGFVAHLTSSVTSGARRGACGRRRCFHRRWQGIHEQETAAPAADRR